VIAKIEAFEAGGAWLWQVRAMDKDSEATMSVAANSARDYPTEEEALAVAQDVAKKLGLQLPESKEA